MSAPCTRQPEASNSASPATTVFPEPDVALEEPGHGPSRLEIRGDLAHRALLRSGQRERQGFARALPQRVARRQDDAPPVTKPGALFLDTGREHPELLAGEEAPRGLRRFQRRREVDVLERRAELLRIAGGRVEGGGEAVERPARERAPQTGRNVAAAMVDPHDPARMHRIRLLAGGDEFGLGILDPHLAPRRRRRSAEEGRPRRLERPDEGGIAVVPHDADRAAVVGRDRLDSQHPAPHAHGANALEPHEDRRRAAPLEPRDGGIAAPVLVAERQRQEKVADRPEAVRRQTLGRARLRRRESGRRDRADGGERRKDPASR